MAEPHVIQIEKLRKQYEQVEALRGFDLHVPSGSICGLLGRNGAGKTTTLKILLGLVRATSGSARVFGLPVDAEGPSVEIRRRTAFVSEDKDLLNEMTLDEIVRFTRSFYPKWRSDLERQYVDAFGLPTARKIAKLSRGERTRVALLLAFCRGAELLVLDEPTTGLDPAANHEVLQAIVRHVAAEPVTVVLSSHQIADVEQVCDRVAIVDRGRTLVAAPLDALRENYRRVQMVFAGGAPDASFRSPGVERVERDGRVLSVLSSAGAEQIVAESRSLNPIAVDVLPVTLKEIFLETVKTEG